MGISLPCSLCRQWLAVERPWDEDPFTISEEVMKNISLEVVREKLLDHVNQLLLSSLMDKTVRLWNLSSKTCLKTFSHSDYVTCIQFNPADDRYFISGSLDAKVHIWSIPDRQVVDWNDLHEMVTAACYTPDGQGALVGSYKGSCRLYNTSVCSRKFFESAYNFCIFKSSGCEWH